MSTFSDNERFDVLLSTVGSNPITSLVTAAETLKDGGKLLLLGSEASLGDRNFALDQVIAKILQPKGITCVAMPSEDSVTKAAELISLKGVKGKIGIDFTGGTKPLSAGSLLGSLTADASSSLSSVFLNPRSNTVDVEDLRRATVTKFAPSLTVTFAELLSLYRGESTQIGCPNEVWLAEFENAFRLEANPSARLDTVRSLNRMFYNSASFADMLSDASVVRSDVERELVTAAQQFGAAIGQPDWLDEEARMFLTGIWLESYVHDQLQKTAGVHECFYDVTARVAKSNGFQVDVLGVVGHRLVLLTCSTALSKRRDTESNDREASSKKSLKLKMFEGMQRAKQLGGDASLVGLVCLGNAETKTHRSVLEREVNSAVDSTQAVRVFDNDDFDNLSAALGDWIAKITAPNVK